MQGLISPGGYRRRGEGGRGERAAAEREVCRSSDSSWTLLRGISSFRVDPPPGRHAILFRGSDVKCRELVRQLVAMLALDAPLRILSDYLRVQSEGFLGLSR